MRLQRVVAAVALAMLAGCSSIDRTTCVAISTGTGAVLGGLAGGLASYSAFKDDDISGGSRNWRVGGTSAGGFVAGGAIGWALSNAICEEPPPPPPPPAPPVARTPPPPPPPPPSNRRGG
jgi:hypothetical protein